MKCRHCNHELSHRFLDLGFSPPSNAYLNKEQLQEPEVYFPLRVFVCDSCWLVQTEDHTQADLLFSKDYAYFSSTSTSWLNHASNYADTISRQLELNTNSHVVEIASNDGYLLQYFREKDIPCLGIEPTESTASAARNIGIPVVQDFFGERLAQELIAENKQADLIVGNNVFAHVPDINDFTEGMKLLLKKSGTITLEFPHLLNLINLCQFDTVYHEHFSYLSLTAVRNIAQSHDLEVWKVEKLSTHGGSLRVYLCHSIDDREIHESVDDVMNEESETGLTDLDIYASFQEKANIVKNNFLKFLILEKEKGKRIAAYGAAAKGNTLVNYAGIKTDLIDFVCDAASAKQNKYLPGSHIPILDPAALKESKPDWVIVFPWNIIDEVKTQHSYISEWGGKFITIIPRIHIHDFKVTRNLN